MKTMDPMEHPPLALVDLETISLADLNALAALQTRVDRKYVVTRTDVSRLVASLPATSRLLEIDGATAFGYSSTYFDTDDLTLYRAAAHRRRRRFKVRSRLYEQSGTCMLEVKTKTRNGRTEKSRVEYDAADRMLLSADACAFVEEANGNVGISHRLGPVLTTQYHRRTLADLEACTRLTVDTDLVCVDRDGNAASLDAVVVETKSAGRPSPADRLLWQAGIRPVKISKFCTGLAVLNPTIPSNRWHRALQQNWRIRPASS